MRVPAAWSFALLASLVSAGVYPPDVVDQLQESGVAKLKDYLAKNPAKNGCTFEKAVKRKEWCDRPSMSNAISSTDFY